MTSGYDVTGTIAEIGGALAEHHESDVLSSSGELIAGVAEMGGAVQDGESIVPGAIDTAMGGIGLTAALIDDLGPAKEVLGPLGMLAGGAAQMIGGGVDMVEHFDQIDQGYFSNDEGGRNEFWGGAGEATLGGAHALIGSATAGAMGASALLGPAAPFEAAAALAVGEGVDTALSMGELGVDVLGMGAGLAGDALGMMTGTEHDWSFGAADVVGLAEHAAFDGITGLLGIPVGDPHAEAVAPGT